MRVPVVHRLLLESAVGELRVQQVVRGNDIVVHVALQHVVRGHSGAAGQSRLEAVASAVGRPCLSQQSVRLVHAHQASPVVHSDRGQVHEAIRVVDAQLVVAAHHSHRVARQHSDSQRRGRARHRHWGAAGCCSGGGGREIHRAAVDSDGGDTHSSGAGLDDHHVSVGGAE